MLRSIDHFIGGSSFASGERQGDVFDPNQGQVQAQVRLGTAAELQKAVDAAKAAQPAWAATNPQRRARVMFEFKRAGRSATWTSSRDLLSLRARQGHRRRAGRRPARARGDRVRLRHPAGAEGRIHRGRRPRHRRLFDAPAARHRRRHHPVQLPGDDPDVDVRHGDRRAATPSSSSRPSATRRVPVRLAELMMEAGAPDGRAQRRPRRQGNGRRDPRPSRTSRRSASSARPTSRSTSTRAAPRTGSACRRWAAPRTTASSCPTPTSTRSSTTSPARPSARPASAAWRCRWSCRSARRPPTRCARS